MALLPDLDVRTVLNVVEENFESVGLKTYAIRMVYIGEHALQKGELIKHFRATIYDVNSGYCDVNVFGILLVYDSYFVHVLEGSEDTVHRHLRFLFDREKQWMTEKICTKEVKEDGELSVGLGEEAEVDKQKKMFKRMKLLLIYHSIKTLIFNNWRALIAQPPSLVGKLDPHGPMAEHMEQLRICLDKVKRICEYAKRDNNLSFEDLSAVDPKIEALPEVALIDYLLQSPHILDLRSVAYMHRRVDDYIYYFEKVWPLPTHFTPQLLYQLKVDDSFVEPLPIMPWELVKKDGEGKEGEEEKEERQSDSSFSD